MLISAMGHTVRNAVTKARAVAALPLDGNRVRIKSGGEDGLYRCHLESGHIVEVTVIRNVRAEAEIVEY